MNNLFEKIPKQIVDEHFLQLLNSTNVRIERIVSHGNSSPCEFWYEQAENEWVVVLQGEARLQFEDGIREMKAGDYVNIPAGVRHRVEWTTPHEKTIWLAVFY